MIKGGNKTVIKAFVWKMLERIFAQGIGLLVQIMLARILLPSDFVSLAIIVAITNFAALFVQSGLSAALIQKKDIDSLDISTVTISSIFIALFFYLILFFSAPFISVYYNQPVLCNTLRVFGIVLFFNAINAVQIAIMQRNMKFKELFIRNMIAVPISGIIGIILAKLGFGIWALVIHNLSNVIILVLSIYFISNISIGFNFSTHRAKQIYSFSGKILAASLVSGFFDTFSTMFIGKKYSSNELAFYDKGYTYSSYIVKVVGYSISSVMLPVLSRQQGNLTVLKTSVRNSIRFSAFFMFPLLFGIAASSTHIVYVILSEKWLKAAPFLALFSILRLPECMLTIDKQAFCAIGRSDICLKYEVLLCVINIFAFLITMNKGVFNIALSLVIANLLASLYISFQSSILYNYTISERFCDILKPLMNSILMCIIIRMITKFGFTPIFTIIIQLVIGIIIYILLSFVLKDKSLKIILNNLSRFHLRKGELK